MRITFTRRLSAVVFVLAFCLPLIAVGDVYKPDPGPYELVVNTALRLDVPELDKQTPLRISYPDAPGPHPVVVFSHGGGCLEGMYAPLADHWATHGYVVIQPTHMDSRSLGFSFADMKPGDSEKLVYSRRRDMQLIIESLDIIEASIPALAGQLDREQLVASGHSMGGGTAMAVTGLRLQNTATGVVDGFEEDRFGLLLLIGDPGNRSFVPEAPWRAIAIPTFIVTGTSDHGANVAALDDGVMQSEFAEGTVIADTPNYYLFIKGMDHYMGGLICRSNVPGEPDQDAVVIARGVSTAFLDAYTKDDAEALRFLEEGRLVTLTGGRATLETR